MSIFSLNKHESIKRALLLLEAEFQPESFVIDTQTNTTERGIYIHHRENEHMRAYLFTVGQDESRYGVHLEFPEGSASGWPLESYEDLPFSALSKMLEVHLDLLRQ